MSVYRPYTTKYWSHIQFCLISALSEHFWVKSLQNTSFSSGIPSTQVLIEQNRLDQGRTFARRNATTSRHYINHPKRRQKRYEPVKNTGLLLALIHFCSENPSRLRPGEEYKRKFFCYSNDDSDIFIFLLLVLLFYMDK